MDIAQHIRIFDKTPSDELVEKRTKAIGALAKKYAKLEGVENLLQLAADLTAGIAKGGSLPGSRVTEVETAIKATSSSFVREGQDIQILACALMAALKVLTEATVTGGGWSRRDVLALGLWSGLGFQLPRVEEKLEGLRSELLIAARSLATGSTANARRRQDVPAIALSMPTEYEETEVADAIQNGAASVIDALRINAALDREELDLLWWVLSGWSKFADKPFASMSDTAAVVAAGLEAGSVVRRMPAEAHKHLILRLLKHDKAVSLEELLESLTAEQGRIAAFFAANPLLLGREALFPLITACIAGRAGGKSAGARSIQLSDWAARSLLESSILHVGRLSGNLV